MGRLGGDEFVVVLDDIDDQEQASEVARTIIDLINQPFALTGDTEVTIGCSIGIRLFPQDGDSVEQLLERADAALYEVKRGGRNGYRYYQR